MITDDAVPTGARAALLAAARAELTEHGRSAISLRAVARRAGVSHAAPKHHFADRAGLLTAVAIEGFTSLGEALVAAIADTPTNDAAALAALGRAYIDFGLTHPALFDLMFRPSELNADDPALIEAERRTVDLLSVTVDRLTPPERVPGTAGTAPSALALTSWALVHGLVVLTRDGSLPKITGVTDPATAAAVAHALLSAQPRPATPGP